MPGMSRHNGKTLSALDYLRQSIEDILTTPIGSRVLRRDYGSRLFSLIDKPMNSALQLDIFVAAIEAIRKWEPSFVIERIFVTGLDAGRMSLGVIGNDSLGNRLEISEVLI